MKLSPLTALSPLDGRYAAKTEILRPFFSEYALIRRRVIIEIRWLQFLAAESQISEVPELSPSTQKILEGIIEHFSEIDAERIKTIEQEIQHDVKAVEYFLKEKLQEHPELKKISEFVHFGCTSEDINNLAYALMLRESREKLLLPLMEELNSQLQKMAHDYADIAILARTHGQAATPTTLGKEFANVVARLRRQHHQFSQVDIMGKFNGAVGNFNAHYVTYPSINWPELSRRFVTTLGIQYNAYTTQIEPHDYIAEFCDVVARFNTILIDLSRDIWAYISLGYFRQHVISGEVGSSTMPHKVNPILFENAEGNASLANALLQFLAQRLPVSRWQRDLVDSTLLRNLGSAIGYSIIAWQAIAQGLKKLAVNETVIAADLEQQWAILAEPIQTLMRKYGIEQPYEKLKALTRGKAFDQQTLHQFIDSLDLPNEIKQQLFALTPSTYLGYAPQLARTL